VKGSDLKLESGIGLITARPPQGTVRNYFNYFTEIEEEFVRRRGSHLLVSPLDWSLIETWKQRGIPLRVALRGITQSFDSYDKNVRRGRKVNSLFYCQQAVEEAFQQYREAHTGANPEGGAEVEKRAADQAPAASPLAPDSLRYALHEQREAMSRLSLESVDDWVLAEAFNRAARRLSEIIQDLNPSVGSMEQLDADLGLIEAFLLEALRQHAGETELARLRQQGDQELKPYRKGMEPEIYDQTLNNWMARKLREQYRVPRLSLFYL